MTRSQHTIYFLSMLCICLFIACTKSSSNNSQTRTLNQVETQLLGTWYVRKQVDTQLYYVGGMLSNDTSKTYCHIYTNFTTANQITFKSGAYNSSTVALGNNGLQCIDNSYGLSSASGCASPTGLTDSVFWYYDDVDLMQLQINQSAFYVVTLTSDSLVLWYNNGDIPIATQYNYNWCYLHR